MNYTIETLQNGVRFVHVPMPSNPAVTSMVLVNVGSEFERESESGISHFLEHMLFKGTKERPRAIDISRELDEVGASYNAFTSTEITGYHVKAARIHFEKVTRVLADMFWNAELREEDVSRERGVILEEINMYQDLPQERVSDLFTNLLYGDQPAGWDILGTKKTVKSFTSKDFKSFKRRHYVPEKIVVVVAGGVRRDKAERVINDLFVTNAPAKTSSRPGKKPKTKRHTPPSRIAFSKEKTDQTHFILGGVAADRYSDDAWPMRVLAAVLSGGMSGRIFQRIREDMGAAYYADFSAAFYSDHGHWALSAGVTNGRTEEVLKASLDELSRIRTETLDESELKKAKDYLIGSSLLYLETSGARARFYGTRALFNDKSITVEEFKERIMEVSAEDIQRVANTYLKPEKARLALIGPNGTAKRFEALLSEK